MLLRSFDRLLQLSSHCAAAVLKEQQSLCSRVHDLRWLLALRRGAFCLIYCFAIVGGGTLDDAVVDSRRRLHY